MPRHFYPRSPCGERPKLLTIPIFINTQFLSTLSLRRATIHHRIHRQFPCHFYPRSPCGERREPNSGRIRDTVISIHALLAESDRLCTILYSCPGNFYPRSPCGERQFKMPVPICIYSFLSTLSLRRATVSTSFNLIIQHISIHALLAESDVSAPNKPEEQ